MTDRDATCAPELGAWIKYLCERSKEKCREQMDEGSICLAASLSSIQTFGDFGVILFFQSMSLILICLSAFLFSGDFINSIEAFFYWRNGEEGNCPPPLQAVNQSPLFENVAFVNWKQDESWNFWWGLKAFPILCEPWVARKERRCTSNICKYQITKVAIRKEWKACDLSGAFALSQCHLD